jgi:7-cyano-7-deazaguanine synthase
MKNREAVVLLSGGIDSSTTLAVAQSQGYRIHALSFDYNQKHIRELDSARRVALAFSVQRHLVIRFDLRDIGGSALTSDAAVPAHGGKEPSHIPITYVPARNTIFLSFALAWAEALNTENIFIGANSVDYSGYPDCRPEYLTAFEKMSNLATKASVEGALHFKIHAPLISLKKSEIIQKGVELGIDYSLTWSCYDPQLFISLSSEENKDEERFIPCRKCDSCVFREKGFQEAGIKDPLISTQ